MELVGRLSSLSPTAQDGRTDGERTTRGERTEDSIGSRAGAEMCSADSPSFVCQRSILCPVGLICGARSRRDDI